MVAVTSRVVPSAPVPREAAAESSFPGQDLVGAGSFWQAAQSAHWGFEASAGPSHPTGQLARHGSDSPNRPSEPPAPLESPSPFSPPPVPTPLPLGGDGTDAPGMRGGGAPSPSPSHHDTDPGSEPEPEPEHEIRPLVEIE